MELKSFTVSNFRSINGSTTVEVEPDVTCLMGKNESGKSALLEALYLLNPIHEEDRFEPQRHIPWDKANQYHPNSDSLKDLKPITAVFDLTSDEADLIGQKYGDKTLRSTSVEISRSYTNDTYASYADDEGNIRSYLISLFPRPLRADIENIDSESLLFDTSNAINHLIEELINLIDEESMITYKFNRKDIDSASNIIKELLQDDASISGALHKDILKLIPKFVRFTDYHLLAGRVAFDEIRSPSGNYGIPKERVDTIRSLLRFSPEQHTEDNQLTVNTILEMSHDERRKFLDATARHINKELEERWTQARRKVKIQAETLESIDHISVYVENEADGKDFIEEESAGFKWFLSFIVAFSDQIVANRNTVLLLDEPGLGLHGRQQEQLLKFIIDKNHPVIYTTHSFALVEDISPAKIRLVEQTDIQTGTRVYNWDQYEQTDRDTFFPLVVALGYKISSQMYWGGNILLVEGYSDLHYLTSMESICSNKGASSRLPRDLIVRFSSGKNNIRNLVALIGPDAPIIAIIDSDTEEEEELKKAAGKGNLKNLYVIEVGYDILSKRPGSIEDLFEPEDYISMCKMAGHDVPTIDTLKDSGLSIVKAIIEALQIPADQRGAFKVEVASTLARGGIKLHDDSLRNFKKLFGKVKTARTQLAKQMRGN